jgi:hypothetical protein
MTVTGPGSAPALRMRHQPQVEHLPDGTWRASYAGLGWSITAPTEQAAFADLQAEDRRRVESDPAYGNFLFHLALRNLADPSEGIEVEEIDRVEYRIRTFSPPPSP